MPINADSSMLMVALLALLAGLAIGLIVAWITFPRARRMRQVHQERDEARHELDKYRGQVNDHFAQSSTLFREMTEKYREVYDHLSQGAQELCTRKLPRETLEQAERRLPLSGPIAGQGEQAAQPEHAADVSDAATAAEDEDEEHTEPSASTDDTDVAAGPASGATGQEAPSDSGAEEASAAGTERRGRTASH